MGPFLRTAAKREQKDMGYENARRPCIAKRLQGPKKVMYAIFFTPYPTIAQIAVPKGRSVTGLTYKNCILKKVRKYFVKRRPKTGLKGVKRLHDNAPCHKSKVMTDFLNKEKV